MSTTSRTTLSSDPPLEGRGYSASRAQHRCADVLVRLRRHDGVQHRAAGDSFGIYRRPWRRELSYVLLVTGVLIGLVMQLYGSVKPRLPNRRALRIIQLAMTGVLMLFFFLFQGDTRWVSSGFYFFGQILGTLLLSQFWTLANAVYDPRQARRLFGFVGGGASLGGMAGSGLAALLAGQIGTPGLLLASAVALVAAVGVVICILVTETRFEPRTDDVGRAQKGGLAAALTLVRQEPSLRRIASLVSLAAIGSVLIDQQLNMAAEEFRGGSEDSVTSFLASVRFLLSAVSLVFQVFVVKRIYRLLGVGFAVLALPASLGITAVVILFTGVLLAPTVTSVVDRSIRYTIDRTTREIFFLPLSGEICGARETLIGYGPAVVDVLEYFLADPEEDIWVRRHIPAILARIPCQRSIDILVDTLGVADSFLRFKAITAIQRIRREHPSLTFKREPIEDLLVKESRKYFNRLGLHHNLFRSGQAAEGFGAVSGCRGEDRTDRRPNLPTPRAGVPVEGHRRGEVGDRTW